MSAQPVTCSACGASGSGKFCSACGASLGARTCAACRAELSPEARFCHRCGQPVDGAPGARSSDRTAWLIAGALCLVLVGGIVYKITADAPTAATPDMANTGSAAAEAGDAAGTGPGGGLPGPPPDISRMTPRERFDRLFNRIMSAAERGDRGEVERFTPMALGAYDQLDAPDADARYHAAVLHLQVDRASEALALADTILAASPGHLFGYILHGTAAQVRNDAAARRAAQRDFLSHYEAEMNARRVEYADHKPVVDEFKREAEAAR